MEENNYGTTGPKIIFSFTKNYSLCMKCNSKSINCARGNKHVHETRKTSVLQTYADSEDERIAGGS